MVKFQTPSTLEVRKCERSSSSIRCTFLVIFWGTGGPQTAAVGSPLRRIVAVGELLVSLIWMMHFPTLVWSISQKCVSGLLIFRIFWGRAYGASQRSGNCRSEWASLHHVSTIFRYWSVKNTAEMRFRASNFQNFLGEPPIPRRGIATRANTFLHSVKQYPVRLCW